MSKSDEEKKQLIEAIKAEAKRLTDQGLGGVRFTHSGLTADAADELFWRENHEQMDS